MGTDIPGGRGGVRGRGRGWVMEGDYVPNATVICHHQNDACIKTCSNEGRIVVVAVVCVCVCVLSLIHI